MGRAFQDPQTAKAECEKQEALEFRKRTKKRQLGRHRPPPLPEREKPRLGGVTHLVIGDGHVTPEHPAHRWEWLGAMISDLKPGVVIDIGDSASMDSLCHYDQGKKCFEGKRFWRDVDAYVDAKERLGAPITAMPKRERPRLVKCNGNHEHRIDKIIAYEPRFEGIVGLEDLRDAELGWEVYPFLQRVEIDGITYVHYAKQFGATDRPVGGVNIARTSILKYHTPMVVGHTHRWGYHAEPDGRGGMIQCFNSGCYFEHDEDYAGTDVDLWTRGILELRGVENGKVRSWRWHDIREIEAKYG